jgi:hypothetical protein
MKTFGALVRLRSSPDGLFEAWDCRNKHEGWNLDFDELFRLAFFLHAVSQYCTGLSWLTQEKCGLVCCSPACAKIVAAVRLWINTWMYHKMHFDACT